MIDRKSIEEASVRLSAVIPPTPLQHNTLLSQRYGAQIWLKREDLNIVRSYKNRGAFNKMSSLTETEGSKGVVCASAGNHAQGVAFSCSKLGIAGRIFMPEPTPKQKIKQVEFFGKEYVNIELAGDTFDDAYAAARDYCAAHGMTFIHPFDDELVITGQGTVGAEIVEQMDEPIDCVFVPIGGGGLSAGVCSYLRQSSPDTEIYGVEPLGAPAMKTAIESGEVITLDDIDTFVDGAAVKQAGRKTYDIVKDILEQVILVHEGKVCSTLLELYNQQAIVAEPAGALTIAALEQSQDLIRGKNVVCVLSGGNNDILRTEEIKERSLLYEGLKHYFIVRFPQRAGALKEFVSQVLGPDDGITRFEYTQRNNKEYGPALVGIELLRQSDFDPLVERMKQHKFKFQWINENQELFNILVQ